MWHHVNYNTQRTPHSTYITIPYEVDWWILWQKTLYSLKIKNIYLTCGTKNIKLKISDSCTGIHVNVLIHTTQCFEQSDMSPVSEVSQCWTGLSWIPFWWWAAGSHSGHSSLTGTNWIHSAPLISPLEHSPSDSSSHSQWSYYHSIEKEQGYK